MFRAMIHRLPESRPIPYPFLEGMPERSDVSRHDRYFACRHRRVTSTTDDQPHQPVEQIARRVEKAARRFEQRARRAGFRYLAGRGKSSAGQAGAYWTKNGVRDNSSDLVADQPLPLTPFPPQEIQPDTHGFPPYSRYGEPREVGVWSAHGLTQG
jgi:hypothetical protein